MQECQRTSWCSEQKSNEAANPRCIAERRFRVIQCRSPSFCERPLSLARVDPRPISGMCQKATFLGGSDGVDAPQRPLCAKVEVLKSTT
jgi:hypothetical protein